MKEHGTLVISLDFELLWGAIDLWPVNGYAQSNVQHVPEVIERLLHLLEKYEVKATFATVGFLMLQDVKELRRYIPSLTPSYNNQNLQPYGDFLERVKAQDIGLYFAPSVIDKLKKSSYVEVGTHTFSHYYCWEKGQSLEEFDADLATAKRVANVKGVPFESIVFPRNQITEDYLDICAKYGIKTYRGNPVKYFGETSNRWKKLYYKFARLMDAYINWGGCTCYSYSNIDTAKTPMNVPASRMLRPYVKSLHWFEWLRLHRIKQEMFHAARHHELYHLWWHPHNFGADMDKNFSFLEKLLDCYRNCHIHYGMTSMTMKEFYQYMTDN